MPWAFPPVCLCLRNNWKLYLLPLYKRFWIQRHDSSLFVKEVLNFPAVEDSFPWSLDTHFTWFLLSVIMISGLQMLILCQGQEETRRKQLIFKKKQHLLGTLPEAFYSTEEENVSLLSSPSLSSLAWEVQKASVPFWTGWCNTFGQEGRSRELQVCQLHLSPLGDDEENPLRKHFQAHEGQEGDQE